MMQTNDVMKLIYKIVGIMAVIFCGIALVVPWAGIWITSYGVSGGFNIYTWAWSWSIPTVKTNWDFFFTEMMTTSSPYTSQGIVLGVCMILAFIFTLIALFFGIYAIRKINVQMGGNSFLITGIMSVVAMALCIVGVSQLNTQSTGGIGVGYGAGFFLIIVAMILYFVIFALQKIAPTLASSQMMQQQMYTQQPAQYYTQQPQAPPYQEQPYQQTPAQQLQTAPRVRQQPKATQKFCPHCGAPIQANTKFCAGCGNKLG